MKARLFLLVVANTVFLGFFSCGEEEKQLPKKSGIAIADSIDPASIIAAFQEDDSYSLLVFDDEKKINARKLSYRVGFPVFVDSVVKTQSNKFESRRYRTTYYVNDHTVISVYKEKIVHPSSNWQGQTPGQHPIVSVYNRQDVKKPQAEPPHSN